MFVTNKKFMLAVGTAVALCAAGSGCESGPGVPGAQDAQEMASGIHVQTGPTSIPRGTRRFSTDALLYAGDGTWSTEVDALKSLMDSRGMTYKEVSSSELNQMSARDMAAYGAFVWPGGEGGIMAASLSTQTKANIREAVQALGVGYVGFCAGSFVAVAPQPEPGQDTDYGIGVVAGPDLVYYGLEQTLTQRGQPDLAMTLETFADGSTRDLVWYGGPVVPSAPGIVVAKYPTGEAAISELWSGNGWVVLSAVHPAAPQAIRDQFGLKDSDGLDLDLAWTLLDSAIHQNPLPTFSN